MSPPAGAQHPKYSSSFFMLLWTPEREIYPLKPSPLGTRRRQTGTHRKDVVNCENASSIWLLRTCYYFPYGELSRRAAYALLFSCICNAHKRPAKSFFRISIRNKPGHHCSSPAESMARFVKQTENRQRKRTPIHGL